MYFGTTNDVTYAVESVITHMLMACTELHQNHAQNYANPPATTPNWKLIYTHTDLDVRVRLAYP